MSAPRGTVPTHERTSQREDADSRRDIALLQDGLRGMSKRDACDHLADLFPWRSRPWFVRHFERLMRLDPEVFRRLTYADPTGEHAANLADRRRR